MLEISGLVVLLLAAGCDDRFPTPKSEVTGLTINEFMARNDTTITDEAGEYEDWIELYNANATDIDLGGFYLTDDLAVPEKFRIPEGVGIPAGGFLILWADGETASGNNHCNFKLSAQGEQVGLYDRETLPVDVITFSIQAADMSLGRITDGGTSWVAFGSCDACLTQTCRDNCAADSRPSPGMTNSP